MRMRFCAPYTYDHKKKKKVIKEMNIPEPIAEKSRRMKKKKNQRDGKETRNGEDRYST